MTRYKEHTDNTESSSLSEPPMKMIIKSAPLTVIYYSRNDFIRSNKTSRNNGVIFFGRCKSDNIQKRNAKRASDFLSPSFRNRGVERKRNRTGIDFEIPALSLLRRIMNTRMHVTSFAED